MQTFHSKRRVAHSAQDMFALVARVEEYPEFVPLCEDLKVLERKRDGNREVLTANMTVAYKLFHETFTTRVTLDHEALTILVEYLDGPFKYLENRWNFHAAGDKACDIEFYIAYEFRSRSMQFLMGGMFDRAFSKFAEAFEQRADTVYGSKADASAGA